MNWDDIQGRWNQLKGEVKAKWGKLTDDDISRVGGKKDEFVGVIQRRYGYMKDEAERSIDEWIGKLAPPPSTPDKKPA
jgi:uncharacterized protein YjbJ (UPF0337 family)